MHLIDFITRAATIGQRSDWFGTCVCISSVAFDALIRQHPDLEVWHRAGPNPGFDDRTTRLREPHVEIWARSGGSPEQAAVSVHGIQIWGGALPRSNHERLTFHVALNAPSSETA